MSIEKSAKPFVVKKPNVTEVNGYTYDLVLLGLDGKQYDFSCLHNRCNSHSQSVAGHLVL